MFYDSAIYSFFWDTPIESILVKIYSNKYFTGSFYDIDIDKRIAKIPNVEGESFFC